MLGFIVSLGSLIPSVFGKKVSERVAKGIGIGLIVLVLAVVIVVGKTAYDRSVISTHDAEQRADDAEATVQADRDADNAVEPDVQAFQNEQIRIDEAMTEARRADPKGAAVTVGPVTRSYYDTLPPAKENRR